MNIVICWSAVVVNRPQPYSIPQHNSSSVYTALSDNTGGYLWANMLLITCRVIKVIPLYICFCVNYLRFSIYKYVLYILSL